MADTERGSVPISAVIGLTVVLSVLLLSLQVLLTLHVRSLTDAAAHEAARLVVESPEPGSGLARASAAVADLLGDSAALSVSVDDGIATATVSARAPGLLRIVDAEVVSSSSASAVELRR